MLMYDVNIMIIIMIFPNFLLLVTIVQICPMNHIKASLTAIIVKVSILRRRIELYATKCLSGIERSSV